MLHRRMPGLTVDDGRLGISTAEAVGLLYIAHRASDHCLCTGAPPRSLSGEASLIERVAWPWKQWLLWTTLVFGVAVLGVLAWQAWAGDSGRARRSGYRMGRLTILEK